MYIKAGGKVLLVLPWLSIHVPAFVGSCIGLSGKMVVVIEDCLMFVVSACERRGLGEVRWD